jgi:hypothetical protein
MRNPAAQGRRDSNHSEIAKWYEDAYCSVLDLSHVGFGCPDLAIGVGGRMYLREIKFERGHLEPSQKRFQETWRGPKIEVVRTQADVINDVLQLRQTISRGKFGS